MPRSASLSFELLQTFVELDSARGGGGGRDEGAGAEPADSFQAAEMTFSMRAVSTSRGWGGEGEHLEAD